MTTPSPIEYVDAPPQVRAVYDDIKKTRNVADVNNFWKYLARTRQRSSAHGRA